MKSSHFAFRLLLLCGSLFFHSQGFAQLTGCYTVGTNPGDNFSSLTNAGGLFASINTIGLSGDVVVKITTDLPTETGANKLNQWTGAHSLVIVPASATNKTITYTGPCTREMIGLNGADRVTVDGSYGAPAWACSYVHDTGNYLSFVSSCDSYPVIELNGDCNNVTLTNITVLSDNTSNSPGNGGAVNISNTQVNGSNNFNLVNCYLADYSGSSDLFFALQVNAPPVGMVTTGLQVSHNRFNNVDCKSIMLTRGDGLLNNAQLNNNHMYATGTLTGGGSGWEWCAIEVENGSGHTVRGNYIGGTAPFCGGSKTNVTFSGGSELFIPIRFTEDAANAAPNNLDSNVIRNIYMLGSTGNLFSATMIRIERGNCNIGVNNGNMIGDSTVNASTIGGASLVYEERYNSSSNYFRGIYTTSSGTVLAEKNSIGGILMRQGSTTSGASATMLQSTGAFNTTFRSNHIGGTTNNIRKNSNDILRGIFYDDHDNAIAIEGNSISGVCTDGTFNNTFYGIWVTNGNGAPTIRRNVFTNITIGNSSNDVRMYGIYSDHPLLTVSQNMFKNITVNSGYAGVQFYGIYINRAGSNSTISHNYLSSVTLSTTANLQASSVAILTTGLSTFTYDANYIEKFSSLSADNSSYIRGISLLTASLNVLVNNVVLLNNNSNINDILLYGIHDNCAGGIVNVWHNTIDIRGTMSGSSRSACFYRNGTATRNIRNNLFNNRRSGGSGGHYALYHNSTGGTLVSNYNLLYAEENAGKLVRHGSNLTFAAWKTLGFDLNSMNPLAPQNLVDPVSGYQTTTAGNDVATSSLGITIDHSNTLRPLGLGFDMGAFELETTLLSFPLNVELLFFKGENQGKVNQLEWSTANEKNNAYFTLYRSTDATTWFVVSRMEGSGTSSRKHDYTYSDSLRDQRNYYYRLLQTDFNGTEQFSEIIYLPVIPSSTAVNIYPNPASNITNIHVEEKNLIRYVAIYNLSGMLVAEQHYTADSSTITLNTETLPAGHYLVRCAGDQYETHARLIITK